jgi:hypothetical protein
MFVETARLSVSQPGRMTLGLQAAGGTTGLACLCAPKRPSRLTHEVTAHDSFGGPGLAFVDRSPVELTGENSRAELQNVSEESTAAHHRIERALVLYSALGRQCAIVEEAPKPTRNR